MYRQILSPLPRPEPPMEPKRGQHSLNEDQGVKQRPIFRAREDLSCSHSAQFTQPATGSKPQYTTDS
jgi:hypothetical protein